MGAMAICPPEDEDEDEGEGARILSSTKWNKCEEVWQSDLRER